MSTPYILVLFASKTGSTHALAKSIVRGINAIGGVEARLRTVPTIDQIHNQTPAPERGPAYATVEDLANASGVALGSPTQFSNMTSGLQYYLEQTSSLWMNGALVNKPLAVFTSSSSLHGGQETTLMNMMTPFLHHGMILVGVPYTVDGLDETTTGGTPYGASHVESPGGKKRELDAVEHKIAMALGKRLAVITNKLK